MIYMQIFLSFSWPWDPFLGRSLVPRPHLLIHPHNIGRPPPPPAAPPVPPPVVWATSAMNVAGVNCPSWQEQPKDLLAPFPFNLLLRLHTFRSAHLSSAMYCH